MFASEEKCASACHARMEVKELSPELARTGGEKGDGMAKEGDGVRDWCRRVCLGGFGDGRVSGEALTITAGGVEAYGGQDTKRKQDWQDYDKKRGWQVESRATEGGIACHCGNQGPKNRGSVNFCYIWSQW